MTAAVLAVAVAVLAAHNLTVERLAKWTYVPACLATAASLTALGTAAGISAAGMGLSARAAVDSAGIAVIWGLAATAAVVALATAPTTRRLFADRRMDEVGLAGTAYRAGVRIPLGTAVVEEVAFRGVLLALLAERMPTGWAVAASCLLFGLWHLVPTVGVLDVNRVAGRGRRVTVLAAAVVVMAGAGALLCQLRLATGSVLGPAFAHASLTATATVAAYVTGRARC